MLSKAKFSMTLQEEAILHLINFIVYINLVYVLIKILKFSNLKILNKF